MANLPPALRIESVKEIKEVAPYGNKGWPRTQYHLTSMSKSAKEFDRKDTGIYWILMVQWVGRCIASVP